MGREGRFFIYLWGFKDSWIYILQSKIIEMETPYLPLELAVKYYSKWDCDVETEIHNHIYSKFLTGFGKVTYLNGNTYTGRFQKGLMEGEGTYVWSHGLKYQGNFHNNYLTGQGTLTWPDGSRYIGQVLNGKRQGQGEYYCSQDGSQYKGQWKDGHRQGKGVLTFSNGAVYDGEFNQGLREGKGKMKYPSGNEYEGEWRKDKKEGKGIMNWISSSQKYEGSWKNDYPEGFGTYYWIQSRSETKTIKTIYKGEWRGGKREGVGAFFYNNGCRIQGTFSNNLKEGLCAITDQFGNTQLQLFKNDKSSSRQALHDSHIKLPELGKPFIHNSEPTENTYVKMIDISSSQIDEAIFNLLLRYNSELRSDYKTLVSTANKQIFNGLNIEALWKLVKDMGVTNEQITLAKLNRKFYEGKKAEFEVTMPNRQKLELLKGNYNVLHEHCYQNLEWQLAFQNFRDVKLDWDNWPQGVPVVNLNKIGLRKPLDIHNQDHVILYRHFIVYLLQLTLLQHRELSYSSQTTFRKCLQDIIPTIKIASLQISNPTSNIMPSMKTMKVCSEVHTNLSHNQHRLSIPEEYASISRLLLEEINSQRQHFIHKIDKTVSVKQIYCLLCQCGILKQATEKMLFLQRIQRSMDVKVSLLKKDNKNNFPAMQKIVLTSAHFSHIMNYEMIGTELDQILYKLLNRKIGSTHSKEEFLKKYKEVIKSMIAEVEKRKNEKRVSKRIVNFKFGRISSKDRQRDELLQKLEEERLREQERLRKEAQLIMQEKERLRMRKEDVDVKDEDESEQSEQYYD